jgi:hypothetical protein
MNERTTRLRRLCRRYQLLAMEHQVAADYVQTLSAMQRVNHHAQALVYARAAADLRTELGNIAFADCFEE